MNQRAISRDFSYSEDIADWLDSLVGNITPDGKENIVSLVAFQVIHINPGWTVIVIANTEIVIAYSGGLESEPTVHLERAAESGF